MPFEEEEPFEIGGDLVSVEPKVLGTSEWGLHPDAPHGMALSVQGDFVAASRGVIVQLPEDLERVIWAGAEALGLTGANPDTEDMY